MDTYVEQYQAKHGGVILHTWTDVQGGKKANFSITSVSGTPVAPWCRAVLRTTHLADMAVFPSRPADVSASRAVQSNRPPPAERVCAIVARV